MTSSLRAFADSDRSELLVLTPGRIWWKAEIAKERAAAREAMTAVRAVELAGPVMGARVLGGWTVWRWSEIAPVVANWVRGASLAGPASFTSGFLAVTAAAATLAITVIALKPF